MREFISKVRILRWDDHRYYHQSRINQTLHLISAVSFVAAYVLLFIDPAKAAIFGWLVGMVTRQSGHIFFEPRSYDQINQSTYAHKESIKVGYNMQRKGVLIAVWLSMPVLLHFTPDLFGILGPVTDFNGYVHRVGMAWLALGVGGIIFRVAHPFFLRGPACGLAWGCKIVTDPFHNIGIYWKSPLALLHGQWLDPLDADHHHA